MKEKDIGSKMLVVVAFCLIGGWLQSQIITSGEIIFERKTNLEKRYEGTDQMSARSKTWMKKPKIDQFTLYFNETSSLFKPNPPTLEDEDREWATMKNTTYQDFNSGIMEREFSFYGSTVYLKDSIKTRKWIITGGERNIAGFNTKQALWVVNDSMKIYAWFAEQIIPSVGPESFSGLPGAILGLAIEDGGVVYFAKEVKPLSKQDFKKEMPKGREKNTYTDEKTLKEFVVKTFSGRGMGSSTGRILDDLFVW